MKLSFGLMFGLLLSTASYAGPKTEKVNGVPFNCIKVVRYELIRDFAAENRGDAEAIREYREYIRYAPAYACRERKNPKVEHVSWCDGSSCSGATATLNNGKCVVSDKWTGQDDGDIIDEEEDAKNCLRKTDF